MDLSATLSPLTLPCLESIDLADFVEELTQFFDLVQAPVVTNTEVFIRNRPPHSASLEQCLSKMRSAINGAIQNYPPQFTLFINSFDERDRTQSDPTVAMFFDPLIDSEGTCPCISIAYAHHTFSIAEVMVSATHHFNLASASHIALTRCNLFPANLFLHLFSSPTLSRLTFADTKIYQYFHGMREDPALLTKRKNNRRLSLEPYFPALASICLNYLTSFDDGGTVSVHDMMASITFVLNKRPRAHFIEQLELYNPEHLSVSKEDLRTFYRWLSPAIEII